MLQLYEPPAGGQPASRSNTADRYVELKPRRDGTKSDPVAEYCMRHMQARMRSGQPKFCVLVKEFHGRAFREAFVVHIDDTRTPIDV
ncbi:hypothetical protein ACFWNT_43475 [Streptomyces sp. NPDC058409]|uniref:hypothetical protein n=1 Tax=Streptomyces sp. NPDC058409 TaxID=3346484 RepID=UPI003649849C